MNSAIKFLILFLLRKESYMSCYYIKFIYFNWSYDSRMIFMSLVEIYHLNNSEI